MIPGGSLNRQEEMKNNKKTEYMGKYIGIWTVQNDNSNISCGLEIQVIETHEKNSIKFEKG